VRGLNQEMPLAVKGSRRHEAKALNDTRPDAAIQAATDIRHETVPRSSFLPKRLPGDPSQMVAQYLEAEGMRTTW
jgi:hypothetical protein